MPNRLSNVEFGKAVESAVAAAAKRNKLADLRTSLGSDYHHMPWWIVGRVVRDADLNQAHAFAQAVTADISKKSGVDLKAALTIVDGDILVGFMERNGNDLQMPTNVFGP
jgi:hypothetical protein